MKEKGGIAGRPNTEFVYFREKLSWRTSWVPSLGPPAAAWWHSAPCRGCWPSPASSHSAPGYPERAWKKRERTKISSRLGNMFGLSPIPSGSSLGAHLSSSRLRRISSSSSLWMQVPSLLIFSKCFFTSSLHSDCNTIKIYSYSSSPYGECQLHVL